MVLPVAGGGSGQDTEVPVGMSTFSWGSCAAGRLPAAGQVGWGSSSSQSHGGKIHQTPTVRDLALRESLCAVDHPKALLLLAARRRSFGKHAEKVREMALL